MKTLLLSKQDIALTVRRVGADRVMDETIEALTRACEDFDAGRITIPVRAGFSYDEPHDGLLEWMPAIEYGVETVIKVVGYHPGNPQRHALPTVLSTAMMLDTATGHVKAIVDATFMTSVRTGAASAVASRILASPASRTVGLIGAGAQAVTQLHALSRVFNIERVLIHDIDARACDSFGSRIAHAGLEYPLLEATTVAEIVQRSDIVCTATSQAVGSDALFAGGEPLPHAHFNAVGSDFPGKIELPAGLLRRALVCPDFREQAAAEGECQQLDEAQIGPDLVALAADPLRYAPYRDRLTVFDSTGWALEDVVAARIITDLARECGYGEQVPLACIGDDPKSPYGFVGDVGELLGHAVAVGR
jgi:ornithine cyclodeaminase/alanine dehydrogenase-like protein (mu-crystallin family)